MSSQRTEAQRSYDREEPCLQAGQGCQRAWPHRETGTRPPFSKLTAVALDNVLLMKQYTGHRAEAWLPLRSRS